MISRRIRRTNSTKALAFALTVLLAGESFFLGTGFALAQTTTDEVSPPTVSVVEETPTPVLLDVGEEGADLQGASSTPQLQETFSDQDAIDPSDTTEDEVVDIATTTEETLPLEEAGEGETASSTEDGTATSTEELPAQDPALEPVEEEIVPPEDLPPPLEVIPLEDTARANDEEVSQVEIAPIVIPREELRPTPEYSFSVNKTKRIGASRKIKRSDSAKRRGIFAAPEVQSEVLDIPPAISVDNAKGVMNISGSCSDKYYVILVYKNETDYDANKRSYIVNRAFPCENGTYSYDIVNLPPTLPDGTYYLLVAGMGEDTPWEPITGLSEINLQRNPE